MLGPKAAEYIPAATMGVGTCPESLFQNPPKTIVLNWPFAILLDPEGPFGLVMVFFSQPRTDALTAIAKQHVGQCLRGGWCSREIFGH